jgi:hypothetical protein
MVPGIAAGNSVESDSADPNVKKYIDTQNGTSGVPVVEFNENDKGQVNSNFYNNKKVNFTKSFTEKYHPKETLVVNKDNFWEYLQ